MRRAARNAIRRLVQVSNGCQPAGDVNRRRKRAAASSTSAGWSRWGEWPEPGSTRASAGPATPDSTASTGHHTGKRSGIQLPNTIQVLYSTTPAFQDLTHHVVLWNASQAYKAQYAAAYQPVSRINHFPSRFELIAIASVLQYVPGFVCGHIFQAREHTVDNFRPAIREAFPMPLRGKLDTLFFGEKPKLSNTRGGRQEHEHRNTKCSFFHDFVRSPFRSKMKSNSLRKITQRQCSNNGCETKGQG